MPCPFSHGSDRASPNEGGSLSRRDFVGAAIAIGGASGLSACVGEEGDDEADITEQTFPLGPTDLSALPERQHAWTEFLMRDRFGDTILPQHHLLLMLDYIGAAAPRNEDEKQIEAAFETIERAFQRGTGGDQSAAEHEGLLFVVGYSPAYFDRFDESLPASIDLPQPADLLEELEETEPEADSYDAAIHLCSAYGTILLGVEEALFGDRDRLNGITVEGTLAEAFEVSERRTGFFGHGQPAAQYDHDDIPESAQLAMGFKSGFGDTLPPENRVTIPDGPFAQGTTMQVSRLELDLDSWYSHDHTGRVHRMFSPEHTPDQVGEIGQNLASSSGITDEIFEATDQTAREEGLVGHAQKLARARDPDGVVPILRRDFNLVDRPGMHFDSWQREMNDFADVRKAMNASGTEVDIDAENDGILEIITVTNRATFLMPPRSKRALPTPSGNS